MRKASKFAHCDAGYETQLMRAGEWKILNSILAFLKWRRQLERWISWLELPEVNLDVGWRRGGPATTMIIELWKFIETMLLACWSSWKINQKASMLMRSSRLFWAWSLAKTPIKRGAQSKGQSIRISIGVSVSKSKQLMPITSWSGSVWI